MPTSWPITGAVILVLEGESDHFFGWAATVPPMESFPFLTGEKMDLRKTLEIDCHNQQKSYIPVFPQKKQQQQQQQQTTTTYPNNSLCIHCALQCAEVLESNIF